MRQTGARLPIPGLQAPGVDLTSLRYRLTKAAISLLGRRNYAIMRKSKVLIENSDRRTMLHPILASYLLENGSDDFFFIQVGAYDGLTGDPIWWYIRRYGWRGILLEPQRDAFRLLQENCREQPQLRLLNAALAARDGVQDFYRVKDAEGLPWWSSQLASFKLENILKHKDCIPNIDTLVEVERVPCVTFNTLLDKAEANKVDLLQIDAEGFDYEIIKTIDFARFKPRIIHYEHKHLSNREQDECTFFLASNGYRIAVGLDDTTAVLS